MGHIFWAILSCKSLNCFFPCCGRLEPQCIAMPLSNASLHCRRITSNFFLDRKKKELRKKKNIWLYWITKPTSCCGGNSFFTRVPPPWLSVFSWSQWLLEPQSPPFWRAKSSPGSTTTHSRALKGKAQASKAVQVHWWKPMSAMYAHRPPSRAGLMISVADSLPVLQA